MRQRKVPYVTCPGQTQQQFGKMLREIYENVVTQEMPEHFCELLKQLEASSHEKQTEREGDVAATKGRQATPFRIAGGVLGKKGDGARSAARR
jgi:hypothetical protein